MVIPSRTGIAFVRVTDHVFDRPRCVPAELPLQPRGEACAAPPAQAGRLDLGDDFLGCHRRQRFDQRVVTVTGDVFVDLLGIDHSPISQGDESLFAEEPDVGHHGHRCLFIRRGEHQFLDRSTFEEMLLDEVRNVPFRQQPVEELAGLDDHHRALGTEAVAPREHDLDFILEIVLAQLPVQSFLDLERLVRNTTGSRTEHQMHSVVVHGFRPFS
jgi:hypothetical protein